MNPAAVVRMFTSCNRRLHSHHVRQRGASAECNAPLHLTLSVSPSPAFPSACDSQGGPSASPPSPPSLPSCHADAAHLEEEYVHRVYDAIASHFSSTRHTPWSRVCHFLSSLPPGSVLADVGCGNGKYLGVNPEVIAVSITMMCHSVIL